MPYTEACLMMPDDTGLDVVPLFFPLVPHVALQPSSLNAGGHDLTYA